MISPPATRSPAIAWVALGLILLLATGLRIRQLGRQSLWLDEYFSLECAFGHNYAHLDVPRNTRLSPAPRYTDIRQAKPWWTIPDSLGHDLHPPLAYLMLRAWCGMFGYSEAAARSLSVLASVVGIGLLYAVARRLHGTAAALWACLLMALAQPQIEFAQEAKHYALLIAWCLGALWIVVRAVESGATWKRCAALLAIALAALFTHYYAAEALLVMGIWAAIRLRGRDRRRLLGTLLIAFTIFAITWGPVIATQNRNIGHDVDFLGEPAEGHVLHTLMRAATVPARLFNDPPPGFDPLAAAGAMLLCVLPWFLLRKRPNLLIWALWMPAVILPTVLIDLRHGTWALLLLRYSMLAGPAVYCLAAVIGSHLRSPWLRYAVPAMLVLNCAISLPAAYLPRKADWRGFGGFLGTHAAAGDAFVFADSSEPRYRPLFYYLGTSHYAGALNGPVYVLDRPADAELIQGLRQQSRVWLISDAGDPAVMLPGVTIATGKFFPQMGSVLLVEWPTFSGVACDASLRIANNAPTQDKTSRKRDR